MFPGETTTTRSAAAHAVNPPRRLPRRATSSRWFSQRTRRQGGPNDPNWPRRGTSCRLVRAAGCTCVVLDRAVGLPVECPRRDLEQRLPGSVAPLSNEQHAVVGVDRDHAHAAGVSRDVAGRAVAVGRLDRVDAELEDAAAAQDLRRDQALAQRVVARLEGAIAIAHASTATAASVAMSGTVRSGVAVAGGVAPEPGCPPRRS